MGGGRNMESQQNESSLGEIVTKNPSNRTSCSVIRVANKVHNSSP